MSSKAKKQSFRLSAPSASISPSNKSAGTKRLKRRGRNAGVSSLRLRAVDAYPTPPFLAPRVAKLNELPLPFARGLVREAKRMLLLCALSGESVAPSNRVDLAWHEMMLFTRWYKSFCDSIGGFIHHDPTPPQSLREYLEEKHRPFSLARDGKLRGGTPVYERTKRNYRLYFGFAPSKRYWP